MKGRPTMNEKIEQLKREIDELEDTLFCINMIDRWSDSDRRDYSRISKLIEKKKKQLVELEHADE